MSQRNPGGVTSSPVGLHRVLEPRRRAAAGGRRGSTPAASWGPTRSGSASSGSTSTPRRSGSWRASTATGGDGDAVRAEVLEIIATRGKMQNPETGSGGMLVGTVEEVGPESPLGLAVGDRVATLVSLTLTPLVVEDGLARWDGRSEQVPADGYAILFGRSIAARLPDDLAPELALSVMDVCGAPALTARVVRQYVETGASGRATAGDRSSPSSVARASPARCPWRPPETAGAARTIGVVPHRGRGRPARGGRARRRGGRRRRPRPGRALRGGHQGGRTRRRDGRLRRRTRLRGRRDPRPPRDGGTVVFFSMATSFSAAALGAEGLAADVTMLVGNGYVPGHADYALVAAARRTRGSAGCSSAGSDAAAACDDGVMRTLLRGGYVHTPADPHATALCVEDGRDRVDRRRRRVGRTSRTAPTGSSTWAAAW